MKSVPVKSSHIESIGYDPAEKHMHVTFTGPSGKPGKTYQYTGVEPHLYGMFAAADSHGKFFAQHVKGKYAHTVKADKK